MITINIIFQNNIGTGVKHFLSGNNCLQILKKILSISSLNIHIFQDSYKNIKNGKTYSY